MTDRSPERSLPLPAWRGVNPGAPREHVHPTAVVTQHSVHPRAALNRCRVPKPVGVQNSVPFGFSPRLPDTDEVLPSHDRPKIAFVASLTRAPPDGDGVLRHHRADGYIAARKSPALAEEHFRDAEDAWQDAGRPGKPRFVMVTFFSLADPDRAAEWIKTYYAFRGPLADQIARENLTTPDAIKGAIRDFENIGVDEMIFLPCTPEIAQLDKLADVIAYSPHRVRLQPSGAKGQDVAVTRW